jgi:hypothetical protein
MQIKINLIKVINRRVFLFTEFKERKKYGQSPGRNNEKKRDSRRKLIALIIIMKNRQIKSPKTNNKSLRTRIKVKKALTKETLSTKAMKKFRPAMRKLKNNRKINWKSI